MDLVEARSDGEEQLLVSGATPGQVDEALDWWRYTKPLGPTVRIVVKEQNWTTLRLSTTGTEVEPVLPLPTRGCSDEPAFPEIHVG